MRCLSTMNTGRWMPAGALLGAALLIGSCDEEPEPLSMAIAECVSGESCTAHADGEDGFTVTIRGAAKRVVVVAVSPGDGAVFDNGQSSIRVTAQDDDGVARVRLIAIRPGAYAIALRNDPTSRVEVTFEPVELTVGPSEPIGFVAGAIEHELCVGSTSARGSIQLEFVGAGSDDSIVAPADRPLAPCTDDGEACCDQLATAAAVALRWRSRDGEAAGRVAQQADDGATLSEADVALRSVRFGGYDVQVDDVELTATYGLVAFSLLHRPSGPLAASPAPGVEVAFEVSPATPTAPGTPLITDEDGSAVLLVHAGQEPATYHVFVTPAMGPTVLLTSLEL